QRAQRDASAEQARSASLARVPSIALIGQYTHQEGQGLGAARDSGFGGLQLDWTVWAWDRQAAAYRAARAGADHVDVQLEGLEAAIRAEIVARRSAVQSAEASVEVAESAVKQADQNRALFQARYEAGAATMLELLDADTQSLRARSSAATARAGLVRAQAALAMAMGE
ncbi:MAG TPA: TolC family protein, partial [Myxococcota bacterium]|nr:TolC family protein [Myxococcota bacterium]